MKKILSLIMLLLTICSGAWALQSYTWNLKTLQTTEILGTVNTIPTASYTATDANGSNTVDLIVQLANNSSDKINTDGVRFNGSSGTGTVADVKINQRLIYFVAPCAGHVTVTGYTGNASKNMYIGTAFNAKTAEDGMLDTKNNGSSSSPFTMEADIASGATCWIYSDGTAITTNIVFEETAPKTKWDAPEISASGWDGTNWTITITGETGASLKYATKASAGDEYGGYADYSTTFTALPGTYVKAYAYDATPTYSNSDETEFVVPAKATVPTPTLTVASYDYVNGGYTITPYCEDENATLEYKMGSGSYISCTSGTPFYLVGNGVDESANKLTLRATKSGWTQSAAYLNGLNVAPATSSPETLIPWQVSSASLEANTMHIYKSVSMAKANAQDIGQTSGNVWKLRTGTNSNTVTLSVNEGYKVSRVSLTAYTNNTESGNTISLSKVSVDGADYNTSPDVIFPLDNGETTKTTATYDSGEGNDMNATSSIVFTFDNSNVTSGKQTQIMATEIKVWYEEVTDLTFDYSADGANAASWTKSPIAVTTNATAIDNGKKFIKDWPSNSDLTVTLTGTNALVTNVVLTYQDSNRLPDAITANDGTEISTSGATQTWTNNAGKNSVTFTLTGSPRLTKIVVTYVDAVAVSTLADRNYGTCVTSQKMDFTNVTDAKAYIATGLNGAGTAVVLTQVYKVPANEPIIIYTTEKTEAATVYVPQTTDDPDAAVADNLLIAGDGTTAYDGYTGYDIYYVASDQFHKANAGTLQSGKAYLKVAQGTGGNSLTIAFDDEATAVEAVAEAKAENAAPVKVIKNGKLYIGNYNVAGQLVK